MKNFIKTATIAAALSLTALAASAAGMNTSMPSEAPQLIQLKDGGTLHKYEDGKMAYENKFGHPVLVKPGEVFTAVDGSSIRMVGNEVARLSLEKYAKNH